jgi:hypothetical protein
VGFVAYLTGGRGNRRPMHFFTGPMGLAWSGQDAGAPTPTKDPEGGHGGKGLPGG